MDYTSELHELCETISREIAEANEKIGNAGGKLTAGDVDYIDKLTHTLKSIKGVLAMMEDDGEYSNDDGMGGSYRGSYGGSYRGRSYARGRGARRDSMGRYSGRGYSRDGGYSNHGDLLDELRELMEQAPDGQTRQDMQRMIQKIEQR